MELGERVFMVLCWVARCDGPLSRFEMRDLLSLALKDREPARAAANLDRALASWDARGPSGLLSSIESFGPLPSGNRRGIFHAAVWIGTSDLRSNALPAGVDGLPATTVYLLEFLADLLSHGLSGNEWLDEAFGKSRVRRPVHEDMTEARWWTSARAPSDVLDDRFRAYTRDEVQTLKDHWLLGLEPVASQEEIAQAFRFKAKQFHPDRLVGEPTNIQDLASREFQRIHEAFNRLRTA